MAAEHYSSYSSSDDITMPYSLEAEQAVLGSILLDPACITQVLIIVKPDYFYLPQHKAIFSTIIGLDATHGGKIDALLVLDSLRKEKVYDDEAGKTYLLQLSKIVPSTANVESYAKIVREKYYIRSLILVAGHITDEATNSGRTADELLDLAGGSQN